MNQLNSTFKLLSGVLMLCLVITLVTSMKSTDDIEAANRDNHFFMEYEIEDCEPEAVQCSRWRFHSRVNCGCGTNSPGNSSSTHSFHKDYYQRTCWTSTSPVAYWTSYSPGVCNSVCQ